MKKCSIVVSICIAVALCMGLDDLQSQTAVFYGCELLDTTKVVELAQGELIDGFTGLNCKKKLHQDNGSYVTLSVENLGDDPVILSINGQGNWHVYPGEQDSLVAEVTQKPLGFARPYRFKVASQGDGSIHIRYAIFQGDAVTFLPRS